MRNQFLNLRWEMTSRVRKRRKDRRSETLRILGKQLKLYRSGKISESQLIVRLKSLLGINAKKQADLRTLWDSHQSGRISDTEWLAGVRKFLRGPAVSIVSED